MTTILQLLEKTVNLEDTVKFPVYKSFAFHDAANAHKVANQLRKKKITCVLEHKMVYVRFLDKEQLNIFAATYFPVLFEESRIIAEKKDAGVRRTIMEIIRKEHPTPNRVMVEDTISTVCDKLISYGVRVS